MLERERLLTAHFEEVRSVARVDVARIELPPAGRTGRHFHPGPVVGAVLSGTIRFQPEGREPTRLRAGDAFYEPANEPIAQFDNASDTEPATFVACYLLPPGESRLIAMLRSRPRPARQTDTLRGPVRTPLKPASLRRWFPRRLGH